MPSSPKVPLDYSSPAQEHEREEQAEAQRRDAFESYNEATFDERHPFLRGPLLRWSIFVLVATVVILLVPRSTRDVVAWLLVVVFGVVESRWNR